MNQGGGRGGAIALALTMPETAVLGLSVLATLVVSNRGAAPETVSARLNLTEGDVRLLVTCPDGSSRRVAGAGGQPDTLPREVTLAPGEQVAGSVNLLQTDAGPTFTQPGSYTLQAEYTPSPQAGWVASAPVVLNVESPQSEEQRGVAAQLIKDDVRLALTLAEPDRAPAELGELAGRYPGTLDGKLARLILAGSKDVGEGEHGLEGAAASDEVLLDMKPGEAAALITSVSTPYSRVGSRLSKRYVSYLESQDAAEGARGSTGGAERERALRILKGQPFRDN